MDVPLKEKIYYFTNASVIPHTLILISTMPKFQLCQHAVALTKSPSAIFHTYHQKKIYFEVYLDLSFLILCHIILRPCLKFQYVPSWQSTYGSDVSYRNMAKSSSFPHFFLYFQEVQVSVHPSKYISLSQKKFFLQILYKPFKLIFITHSSNTILVLSWGYGQLVKFGIFHLSYE